MHTATYGAPYHRFDARTAHALYGRSAGDSRGPLGISIAVLVGAYGKGVLAPMGVILEYLDAQMGTWQYSLEGAAGWHNIRTDLINRPGHMGLALDAAARLRVLPIDDERPRGGARIVLHAAQRSLGATNGCYQAYAAEDRDEAARSITLTLSLRAINGLR